MKICSACHLQHPTVRVYDFADGDVTLCTACFDGGFCQRAYVASLYVITVLTPSGGICPIAYHPKTWQHVVNYANDMIGMGNRLMVKHNYTYTLFADGVSESISEDNYNELRGL
jgi:hypothetical protein